MNSSLARGNKLGGVTFWILSLFCEMPFFLLVGLGGVPLHFYRGFDLVKEFPGLWFGLLVGLFSLVFRGMSLHLVGSWVLKWVLARHQANPLWFGLADFLLANLWIGIWALLDPKGPTSILFEPGAGDLFLSPVWFTAVLPIAFGSMAFRLIFRKPMDAYFTTKEVHS